MKRCVPSHQVYHLWANQAQSSAWNSSRSVSFNSSVASSYAEPIARLVRNRKGLQAVLFRDRSFSVTTSKHQQWVKQAARFISFQFTVPELGYADQVDHETNLASYLKRGATLELKHKRARNQKGYYADELVRLATEAREYCRFFGIRRKMFAAEKSFQVQAAKYAEEQAKREEQERITKREALAQKLVAWRAGADVSMWEYPEIVLRMVSPGKQLLRDTDPEIETSKGALVPESHAIRLYRKLHAGHLQVGDKAGAFEVRSIAGDVVQIGCHNIKLTEVERLAAERGWAASVVPAEVLS